MTIDAIYKPIRQQGNGVTREFSYDFYALSRDYIKVFIETNGVQEEVKNYEPTISENGGVITFDMAPTAEQWVIITRSTPTNQEVPYKTSAGFDAKVIEDSFDKLTAMVQENKNSIARSPKLPEGYGQNVSLPTPESGKTIIWNEKGDGFKNSQHNIDDLENVTKQYRDEAREARDASIIAKDQSVASASESAQSAQNAADTVAGFDQHVEDAKVSIDQFTGMKIDEIDDHILIKEQEFDANAAEKQSLVDAKALEAANSAREAEISRIAAKASENECKRLVESLGVIFAYKGTVPTFSDLPMTDNRNGDVYRVIDQAVFYVWTDTEWQNLGGLIDISSLVTVNTDQEIDAHKTFLKDMGITSKDTDTIIDRNKRLQGLGYYDKNGLRGAVYPYVGASGNVELRLMASTGGASSFGAMGVTADGNPYMYAPKPPKESDDNSVATTDWVNEKDSEVARISNGLLTGNVSTNAEGYADVLKMNSSVAEHKYDVIESSIDTDDEGWHTGELTAVDIDVTKQYKLSIGFRVTGFPHEQGLFNFVSEAGDPNSCLVVDKDQKIKCRFTTTKQQHLEEINYIINPNYEYRVTWEYDRYVGYTINIYDGATLVKSQIINDTDPIDGISPRTLQFGIGYNSGTKLEGQLKGDFIQAYSEDKLVYAPHLAIHYRLSTYGTKIADVEYRDVVFAMYSLKNYAPYFTIDTANRNYTLPMGNIYKGWGSEHKVVSVLPVNPDPNTYYYIPE